VIAGRTREIEPFLAVEVFQRAQALERQGVDVIHLEFGEPDFDTPAVIREAAERALKDGRTRYAHTSQFMRTSPPTASTNRSSTRCGFSSSVICCPSHHMRCKTRWASSSSVVLLSTFCSSVAVSCRSSTIVLASASADRCSRDMNTQPITVMMPTNAASPSSCASVVCGASDHSCVNSAIPPTTQASWVAAITRVTIRPRVPGRRVTSFVFPTALDNRR